jgi:hypothetical protein
MDHTHPRVPSRKLVGDLTGAVAAAVIHDRDLEIVGETGKDLQRLSHDGGDVIFFVQRGKKERKAF